MQPGLGAKPGGGQAQPDHDVSEFATNGGNPAYPLTLTLPAVALREPRSRPRTDDRPAITSAASVSSGPPPHPGRLRSGCQTASRRELLATYGFRAKRFTKPATQQTWVRSVPKRAPKVRRLHRPVIKSQWTSRHLLPSAPPRQPFDHGSRQTGGPTLPADEPAQGQKSPRRTRHPDHLRRNLRRPHYSLLFYSWFPHPVQILPPLLIQVKDPCSAGVFSFLARWMAVEKGRHFFSEGASSAAVASG